jgi:hypothetical protein
MNLKKIRHENVDWIHLAGVYLVAASRKNSNDWRVISWLAEQLLACQQDLCSMELDFYLRIKR